MEKIEQHKDTPVIWICATGMNAGASAELLVKQDLVSLLTERWYQWLDCGKFTFSPKNINKDRKMTEKIKMQ